MELPFLCALSNTASGRTKLCLRVAPMSSSFDHQRFNMPGRSEDSVNKIVPEEAEYVASIDEDTRNDSDANGKHRETLLLRKIDLHLIVPLWLLMFASILDRINLGNVAVLGLPKDLHLKGNQFNIALQAFFATYILFDIPITIALKRSRPSIFISELALLWGVSSMCQGLVKGFGGLLACRLALGVVEAAFTPASTFLMSMYYQRHELQFRYNIFWTAGPLAGSVAGLLAYALEHMQGIAGLAGWRWVLIIEGLLACAFAMISLFLLADWPHQARFLSAEERSYWIKRVKTDHQDPARMDRLDKRAVLRTIKDWKIWCGALMYLTAAASGYAAAFFVPSILRSFGYSPIGSQVHSIPVWAVAAFAAFTTGWLSDRLRHRFLFIVFGTMLSMIGYAILLGQRHWHQKEQEHVRYMAVFFATVGTQIAQPVVLIWLMNNLSGSYKRGIGTAVQTVFGSIGGIIASNIFLAKDSPRYFTGYVTMIVLLGMGIVLSTMFALGLILENKKRHNGKRDYRLDYSEEELDNMGDDHPSFRFTL